MLTAIPGLNHLKIWQPGAPDPASQPTQATQQSPSSHPPRPLHPSPPRNEQVVHRLIMGALDVAAGRKPLSSLSTQRYSPAVLRHLAARRKVWTKRGNASIRSIHAHRTGANTVSICGACNLAGETFAYAAKLRFGETGNITLEALRVL